MVEDNQSIESEDTQDDEFKEYRGNEGIVKRWLKELDTVKNSRERQNYETIGNRIVKNYKNALTTASTSAAVPRVMYNLLWSNVQVLSPALYARMPKVVVERRFKDSDPVGRLACSIAERCASYMLSSNQDRVNYAFSSAVLDRLLAGTGQVWVRYDCDFEEQYDQNGECIVDDKGDAIKIVTPNSEKVLIDPLIWLDYFHSPARNPYEIRWQAKRCYMTRHELKERFGEIGSKIELNATQTDLNKSNSLTKDEEQFLKQAEIWEIWDKPSKKVYWISEGYKEGPLDVKKDPLKLKDFFPCPIPLLATVTSDSMYPTADYVIYERLAGQLDLVTKRISAMVDCVRFVGATAAQFNSEIKNMLKLGDGQLWPIENWPSWVEQKGLAGVIDWIPFDNAVAAIPVLTQYQDVLINQIYEITGIPDIVRGSTDPGETYGAQQEKSHWTLVKIQNSQKDVQRFCRDVASKVAEILFEPGLFSDETISMMDGYEQRNEDEKSLYARALDLLRSDRLRTFRVDIETDSTIAADEEGEQQQSIAYIQALSELFGTVQNITQFRPELLTPMLESALFVARRFRTGRQLEGAFEKVIKEIEDADKEAKDNPPEPPPDYQMQQLQLMSQDLQIKQQDQMLRQQQESFDEWYKQQELMLENQKLQLEAQNQSANFEIDSQKVQIESMKIQSKDQHDATLRELESFKQQFKGFIESQRLELDKEIAQRDSEIMAYKTVLDEKEKFLEEERLKTQQLAELSKAQETKAPEINIVAIPGE